MMANKPNSFPNDDKMLGGFWWGIIIGGVIAFFRGPRFSVKKQLGETKEKLSGMTDSLRESLESVTPSDPIQDSIAEGKEAARRRRSTIMLDTPEDI